jgi:hypothetical protein
MAADEYRRHAIECLRLADETLNARSRVLLVHMAEAWLRLVHQAEKNLATDLLYEHIERSVRRLANQPIFRRYWHQGRRLFGEARDLLGRPLADRVKDWDYEAPRCLARRRSPFHKSFAC